MAAKKAGMATGVEVGRISVKVSPDTKQFRRDLLGDLEAIERSVKANIDVEPNMAGFRREVENHTKGMRAAVKVDADIDRNFVSRITDRLSKVKGPDFGSGINGMGLAAIGGGVLAVAAPLMGLATSALLTLPGLLASVATPIAAITLGLDGIKKSAERLKEPFEGLKATMSAVNEAAFTPVLDKLGAVFPVLERSLPTVSQGIADFARGIVSAVTSPEGLTKIENTIRNIGAAISQAAPGIGDFTSGLLTLAEKFSEKMPGLADWFNGAGQSFEQWIEKITRPNWLTGDSLLDKAFDGLGGTLKTILDTLGGIATAGMEFFQNPDKINDFNNALKGIGDSLTRITELSNSLNNGNLFSSIFPTGFKLDGGFDWESFKADILTPVTSPEAGWRDIWAGMQTAWEETKTSFLASMEIVKTVASTMWDTVATKASSVWSSVVATVQGAIASVQGVVSGIGSTISGIWNNITSTASSAWNGVVSAVQGAWSAIVGAVSNGVSQAVQYVSTLPGQIQGFFADAGSWLLEAGRNVVQGLINGIGSMIGSAVAKAKELASSVKNAVTSFLGIHSPSRVFQEIGVFTAQGFGKGMEEGFAPVLDQAKALAGTIADAFASGTDPTGNLAGYTKQDIDRMEKVLAFETRRLESQAKALDYQARLTGDDTLKNRAADIRMQKDQLGLQREMLGLTQDYSDTLGGVSSENPLADAAAGLMSAPVDFAKATAGQFMSDLGISGDGLLSRLATEGIQYIFQVGSVDQAMSIKDREVSKRALAMAGR